MKSIDHRRDLPRLLHLLLAIEDDG